MNTSIPGNSVSPPPLSWLRRVAIVACLIVGSVFSFRAMTPDVDAKVTSETSLVAEIQASVDVKLVTKNIEDIQLGQRVVGRNPLRYETQSPSEINPATWRAVRLNMIQNGVEYDLAFLRPLSWLQSTGAVVGGFIHMELHEMGLNGPARVVGIDPCPMIEPDNGTGRNVVTGTMAHPGANIVYLDITGLDESLGVTDTHPIWSETRQDFVVAGQLEIGEQFRTVTGQSATLTRIHPHRGPPEMVFNLEVDGQHVYHVANSGLLVHNDCGFVYRGLAEGDDIARGIVARNPLASNGIGSHVAGAQDSQWISTTLDEAIARSQYGKNGVVKIDLSKLQSKVVDISQGIPGYQPWYQLSRRGINDQEVLIQTFIPPEAIQLLK